MKYVDTKVVFREVPDEVTLAINISGCPVQCPGCHSSYLAQDIGEILDKDALKGMLESNPGISCVSFMGGDADPLYVRELALYAKSLVPSIKTSWYSGRDLGHAQPVLDALDYVKVGPFVDEYGPLDWETTNQRFYAIEHTEKGPSLTDWTFKFRKKLL